MTPKEEKERQIIKAALTGLFTFQLLGRNDVNRLAVDENMRFANRYAEEVLKELPEDLS